MAITKRKDRRQVVPLDPATLCAECGVQKGLHRDIAQAGTHDWRDPRATKGSN